MLQTVEAEIEKDGTVTLLEAVDVKTTTRALVTVMENDEKMREKGNVREILELIRSPAFRERPSYSHEEIEAQIAEARNSWE